MPIDWIAIVSKLTWENIVNIFLNFGITGVLVWAAIEFVAKKTIDFKVSQKMAQHKTQLDKELEAYKNELQHNIEKAKLDIARRTQDFSLYTTKRHETYTKLHEVLLLALSRITDMRGFIEIPDYTRMSKEEMTKWLNERGILQEDKDEILELWDSDRGQIDPKLVRLMRIHNRNEAELTYNKLKSYFWISRLYLSNQVTVLVNYFLEQAALLLVYYISDTRTQERAVEEANREQELNDIIDEITKSMKTELKRGYYPEDD